MNEDVKVILITGPAGAGKSTVMNMINDYDEDKWLALKFAGPLKSMLRAGFGLTDAQIEGSEKETPSKVLGGQTPRYAMQTLGTEWGRETVHPDLWALAAVNQIHTWEKRLPTSSRYVLDDARFPNEIELMQEAFNTTVVRIIPTYSGYAPLTDHVSDHQTLDWDYTIENYGDLNTLRLQVNDMMRGIV